MKDFWSFLKSLVLPARIIKYKSINIAISICIFVISSFLLGIPVSQNRIVNENDIRDNYNYEILKQIPAETEINNKITALVNMNISVEDGRELKSANLPEAYDEKKIEFYHDGIKKVLIIAVDLFDIKKVYLREEEVNYNPLKKFTVTNYPYPEHEDVEYYLLLLSSDALYFQAHPWGTADLHIEHNGRILKTESKKIFYQNNIPDFTFSIDNPQINGYKIGEYVLEQLITGNVNTIKLKSYTHTFLVGCLFTLITVLILWIFFRRNGTLKKFKENYNIAAVSSVPVTFIFFILIWFVPVLFNIYIYAFSLFYLFTLAAINNNEELV